MLRECDTCHQKKMPNLFSKRSGKLRGRCKECDRKDKLQIRYGITSQQYDIMRARQKGRCLICDRKTDRLVVDHCHKTKKVRGLLCNGCNTSLGLIQENINILCTAIQYLNNAQREMDK